MRPAPFLPRQVRIDAAGARDRDVRFFRGLAVAVPLSLLLWALILWVAFRWFGGAL